MSTQPDTPAPAPTELAPGSTAWHGVVAWEEREGRYRAWRLLPERAERAHTPDLIRHATMAAGVRAGVRTDATELALDLLFEHDLPATLDLLVDGELHHRETLTTGTYDLRVPLPEGEHDVQLWLPQVGQSWIRPLTLHGATVVTEQLPPSTRWVTYGSSITHCSAAYGPSETWPALVARSNGWDLTSLGFGGQCHLDPIVWHTIGAQPADLVSLCLGINVYGGATLSERTFPGQVSQFLEHVRDAQPEATIAVITPIFSPGRETEPNAVGQTLVAMREQLGAVVEVLARDDDRLHLINGLEVLGPDDAHLLHDRLHPDGEGYRLMGQRLATQLGHAHAASLEGD